MAVVVHPNSKPSLPDILTEINGLKSGLSESQSATTSDALQEIISYAQKVNNKIQKNPKRKPNNPDYLTEKTFFAAISKACGAKDSSKNDPRAWYQLAYRAPQLLLTEEGKASSDSDGHRYFSKVYAKLNPTNSDAIWLAFNPNKGASEVTLAQWKKAVDEVISEENCLIEEQHKNKTQLEFKGDLEFKHQLFSLIEEKRRTIRDDEVKDKLQVISDMALSDSKLRKRVQYRGQSFSEFMDLCDFLIGSLSAYVKPEDKIFAIAKDRENLVAGIGLDAFNDEASEEAENVAALSESEDIKAKGGLIKKIQTLRDSLWAEVSNKGNIKIDPRKLSNLNPRVITVGFWKLHKALRAAEQQRLKTDTGAEHYWQRGWLFSSRLKKILDDGLSKTHHSLQRDPVSEVARFQSILDEMQTSMMQFASKDSLHSIDRKLQANAILKITNNMQQAHLIKTNKSNQPIAAGPQLKQIKMYAENDDHLPEQAGLEFVEPEKIVEMEANYWRALYDQYKMAVRDSNWFWRNIIRWPGQKKTLQGLLKFAMNRIENHARKNLLPLADAIERQRLEVDEKYQIRDQLTQEKGIWTYIRSMASSILRKENPSKPSVPTEYILEEQVKAQSRKSNIFSDDEGFVSVSSDEEDSRFVPADGSDTVFIKEKVSARKQTSNDADKQTLKRKPDDTHKTEEKKLVLSPRAQPSKGTQATKEIKSPEEKAASMDRIAKLLNRKEKTTKSDAFEGSKDNLTPPPSGNDGKQSLQTKAEKRRTNRSPFMPLSTSGDLTSTFEPTPPSRPAPVLVGDIQEGKDNDVSAALETGLSQRRSMMMEVDDDDLNASLRPAPTEVFDEDTMMSSGQPQKISYPAVKNRDAYAKIGDVLGQSSAGQEGLLPTANQSYGSAIAKPPAVYDSVIPLNAPPQGGVYGFAPGHDGDLSRCTPPENPHSQYGAAPVRQDDDSSRAVSSGPNYGSVPQGLSSESEEQKGRREARQGPLRMNTRGRRTLTQGSLPTAQAMSPEKASVSGSTSSDDASSDNEASKGQGLGK